ncbi:MAG: hypothetical protein RJA98_1235 [Pseudomonadota bacterium]|jgi:hypothetical protein
MAWGTSVGLPLESASVAFSSTGLSGASWPRTMGEVSVPMPYSPESRWALTYPPMSGSPRGTIMPPSEPSNITLRFVPLSWWVTVASIRPARESSRTWKSQLRQCRVLPVRVWFLPSGSLMCSGLGGEVARRPLPLLPSSGVAFIGTGITPASSMLTMAFFSRSTTATRRSIGCAQ